MVKSAITCRALELARNTETGAEVSAESFGEMGAQFFFRKVDSNFSENGAAQMLRAAGRRDMRSA